MSEPRPRFAFSKLRGATRRRAGLPVLPTLPVRLLIPNALTLLALSAGLTAVRYALDARFEAAVVAIVAAGIIDGMDGRIARLLNSTSKFGAELDSLSDFVSFGISPVFVLYLWSLNTAPAFGWPVVLFYAMCMSLRLARFNTALDDPNKPSWSVNFFTGVPAPTGAAIALLPLYLDFIGFSWIRTMPALIAGHLIFVGLLLVSRLPTPSFKRVHIDRQHVLPALVIVVAIGALLANFPWSTLAALVAAYLIYLPFSYAQWRGYQRVDAMTSGPQEPPADDPPTSASLGHGVA
jgi:CDP-diacylglycerol--serine O-phosphatidyltransferase